MVPKKIEIIREEDVKDKKYILRRFEDKDVHRIFMAWNNPQSYRYNSIDWNEKCVQDIVNLSWPSSWGMYFMVLEDFDSHEIVATCRFGGDNDNTLKESEWDFGYCTFRSDDKETYTIDDIRDVFNNGVKPDNSKWGKGYSSLMVETIIKIAQDEGIHKLSSGADGMNWGSQKVMMKNGMTFYEFEDDGDVDFIIRLRDENGELLPIEKPTKEELKPVWESYMQMVKQKHGESELKERIEKRDKEHLGDSLMYLLMNRVSRIDELINSKNNVDKIKNIQKDIRNIYSQLTLEEKQLFKQRFDNYKSRWRKRVGDNDFDQDDVKFNLNCCMLIDAELEKVVISHT